MLDGVVADGRPLAAPDLSPGVAVAALSAADAGGAALASTLDFTAVEASGGAVVAGVLLPPVSDGGVTGVSFGGGGASIFAGSTVATVAVSPLNNMRYPM